MNKISYKLFVAIMNFVYFFIKLLPVQDRITMVSRQSDSETLEFQLIRDTLKSGSGVDIDIKILPKKLQPKVFDVFKSIPHMLVQMYFFATSKVLISDSYCVMISVLKHKKSLKIIQIWHALGAVKQFGYQTIGKQDGANPTVAKYLNMHKNYDYVLCSSDITAKYFCEAFNVSEEKIVKIGLPRIDYILKDKSDIKAQILTDYPILNEKKNILYVPTMRRDRKVDVNSLIEAVDFNRYNMVVRLHPLDSFCNEYIKKDGVIYEKKYKTYDLLEIADIIISDYSSFTIEASLLEIPIFLYVYDIDEYKNNNGLNMNFKQETIGKYTFKEAAELVEAFDTTYDFEALREFRDKYIDIDKNNCSGQLADFIKKFII